LLQCEFWQNDIQNEDGIANAAIREAADRIEQLEAQLRQTHKDYGCEIRDPCGTIWEYCYLMRSKAIAVLEWYHRDGSVGGRATLWMNCGKLLESQRNGCAASRYDERNA
jgi:hypothetical protein